MRLHPLTKLAGSLAICLAMAATASAQYGGGPGGGMGGTGGTGGTGSGSTGSGTPHYSYGNTGRDVGIGVGAAAAAAGIALWVHHHHKVKSEALLIGCAQPASNGVSLKSEEDGESYTLISGNNEIKPGERLELKGVLKDDPSGSHAFRVRNVVTDFGACSPTVASTHSAEANELVATK